MRRVAALLEKSGRAVFFVITQVHNCKILAHRATFSLLFSLQNPLNFIKSNRNPLKNATYRLLFEKTPSYRLHFSS